MTSITLPSPARGVSDVPLKREPRIPTLDGLRGLAILGVMCLHFVPARGAGGGVFRALWFGANAGGTGVDLFFVLSGFLITGILYDARGAANYFRAFYMRRVLRIFPLYYAILAAFFLVAARWVPLASMGLAGPQHNQMWLWLYGTNIAMIRGLDFGCFNPFWSLAVEEQFYLIWPMAVLFLSRRSLLRLLIACCGLAVLVRVAAAHYGMTGLLIARGVEALAAGAIVALVSRGPRGATRFLSVSAWCAAAIVPLAAATYLLRSGRGDLWIQVLKPLFLGWVYAVVIALAILARPSSLLARALAWAPLRQVGKLSYAMYALHLPAATLLERRFPLLARLPTAMHSVLAGALLKMLLEICLTIALAWLSWHVLEKHFLRLKRLFTYRDADTLSPAPELG